MIDVIVSREPVPYLLNGNIHAFEVDQQRAHHSGPAQVHQQAPDAGPGRGLLEERLDELAVAYDPALDEKLTEALALTLHEHVRHRGRGALLPGSGHRQPGPGPPHRHDGRPLRCARTISWGLATTSRSSRLRRGT